MAALLGACLTPGLVRLACNNVTAMKLKGTFTVEGAPFLRDSIISSPSPFVVNHHHRQSTKTGEKNSRAQQQRRMFHIIALVTRFSEFCNDSFITPSITARRSRKWGWENNLFNLKNMPQAYFSMLFSSVHISFPMLMIHLKTLATKNRKVPFSIKMSQHDSSFLPEELGTGLMHYRLHRDMIPKVEVEKAQCSFALSSGIISLIAIGCCYA